MLGAGYIGRRVLDMIKSHEARKNVMVHNSEMKQLLPELKQLSCGGVEWATDVKDFFPAIEVQRSAREPESNFEFSKSANILQSSSIIF